MTKEATRRKKAVKDFEKAISEEENREAEKEFNTIKGNLPKVHKAVQGVLDSMLEGEAGKLIILSTIAASIIVAHSKDDEHLQQGVDLFANALEGSAKRMYAESDESPCVLESLINAIKAANK